MNAKNDPGIASITLKSAEANAVAGNRCVKGAGTSKNNEFVLASAAGDNIIGVTNTKSTANGEYADIVTNGIVYVINGSTATINVGAGLMAASEGRVVAHTGSNPRRFIALEQAVGINTEFKALII